MVGFVGRATSCLSSKGCTSSCSSSVPMRLQQQTVWLCSKKWTKSRAEWKLPATPSRYYNAYCSILHLLQECNISCARTHNSRQHRSIFCTAKQTSHPLHKVPVILPESCLLIQAQARFRQPALQMPGPKHTPDTLLLLTAQQLLSAAVGSNRAISAVPKYRERLCQWRHAEDC